MTPFLSAQRALAVLSSLLIISGVAQAQTNPYRSYTEWTTTVQARGMAIPAIPYRTLVEGEIKSSGGAYPETLLSSAGVERVFGVSPGGSYFGVAGAVTRLFIDKSDTYNHYGTIEFPARDAGTNPPSTYLRPVACDSTGNPLNTVERGALETGTVIYDIHPNMYGVAFNLVDVEVANATRIEIRFGADRSNRDQLTYIIPPGQNDQVQFFGWLFDRPITRVVCYLGSFNAADGVVIQQNWLARLTPPPPPCGDLNGDGVVNTKDLQILLGRFGTDPGMGGRPWGDINNDMRVDSADLSVVLATFNTNCGPAGGVIDAPPADDGDDKDPGPGDDGGGNKDPGGKDPGKDPGGKDPGGKDPGGKDPGGKDPGGKDPGGDDGGHKPGDGGGEPHGPGETDPPDDQGPRVFPLPPVHEPRPER